jgi:hypothetical protein
MKRPIVALALLTCVLPLSAAVTGTVMTPEGQPLAGARVSLFSLESNDVRHARLLSANPEAAPLASTQADAKGNFTLASPKEVLADLRIFAPGYEPYQRRVERDEDAGAIALPKAEMKRGTVKANGKAVANATVVLMYNGAEYLTHTDTDGRYEAPDPKRARATAVLHPDFAVSEETAATFNGGLTTLDRTLATAVPLAGKVVGEDGKTPVAKATVFLDSWPLATSGDDGTFTIARPPKKWTTAIAQTATLIGSRAPTSERPLTIRIAKAATVTGRVLDSKTKLPVAGAVVRVNARTMGPRQFEVWWSATSDAKGNYSFNVAPGAYMLAGAHPAYETRPLDVNLASGQTSSKEIMLTPLARVSGLVLNDEKKPVVAAAISTQDARDGMDFTMRFMPNASTVSGPDGRFSFRIRSDSELKIRAMKKGLPPATSEALKLGPAERRTNLVLTIPSGIAVTGKVTDRDSKPLSGVAVVAQQAASGPRGVMMQRMIIGGPPSNSDDNVRTASDGTYTIRVTEGTYDFAFRGEGWSTKNVRGKSISLAGPNVVDTTLEPSVEISGRVVRGGAGIEGVNIFSFADGDSTDAVTGPDGSFTLSGLTPGNTRLMLRKEDEMVNEQRTATAPARDLVIEVPAGVRVSGRVVEKSSHKPVTAFQVGVSISRSGGGMVMMAPPMLRSITSDDGAFVLDNVPIGAVNFVASAPGYTTSRLNLNVEEGKPITDLEVALDTGVRLVGKVTGPDGAPVGEATVRLAMMGGPGMNLARATDKRTTTNSSGEYELESLEPGEETIEITHAKYLSERKTVQLEGREKRLDVQLSNGLRVSGMVVTDSGAGVPEADVEAVAAGGMARRTKSDASGHFELDSLSPARYEFSASKNGFAEATLRDVDVSTGVPVRIVLASGGVIYGFVRGLPEQELAMTIVEVRGSDGTAMANVDASGAYKLEGVPAGTVTVRATMSGRGFASRKTSPAQTVEMASGSSRQLDVEFRSDTVIKGRVRRNGQPVPGAGVMFMPKPGSGGQTSASTTADEQGNYSLSGLENGEYSVLVSDLQRFTSYTTTYEVHGSATFDIDHTASTLRGRVVEASSGDPIADARVQLRNSGGSASPMRFGDRVVATDSAGTFNLDLVPSGTYILTADKDGFGNQVLDLNVTDRGIEDVELRLPRNEGVSLKIVDARDGRALSAGIVVFDLQGRVVLDQRGFFMGAGGTSDELKLPLASGNYQATVMAMGYGTRQISLRSPSTQTVALTAAARIIVHSKHSDRVRARLVDAGGLQYPHWSATPVPTFLNPSPGTTVLDNIAGGTYTLQLLGENGAVVDTRQVLVGDGQTVDVEI